MDYGEIWMRAKHVRLFKYCHDTWFLSENWNVPNYDDIGIEALMNDYDEWDLSKDGKNLLFTIKMRNVLAHRIPSDPNDKTLYDNYIKIILIIACSFGFICDKISE